MERCFLHPQGGKHADHQVGKSSYHREWVKPETVAGPFEAMIHLTDGWPERTSALFIEARNACRAAVAGLIDGDVAQIKFLAAVEAAKPGVN